MKKLTAVQAFIIPNMLGVYVLVFYIKKKGKHKANRTINCKEIRAEAKNGP